MFAAAAAATCVYRFLWERGKRINAQAKIGPVCVRARCAGGCGKASRRKAGTRCDFGVRWCGGDDAAGSYEIY